jgi:hypothetical protein
MHLALPRCLRGLGGRGCDYKPLIVDKAHLPIDENLIMATSIATSKIIIDFLLYYCSVPRYK